jgi:hypothetical protein
MPSKPEGEATLFFRSANPLAIQAKTITSRVRSGVTIPRSIV